MFDIVSIAIGVIGLLFGIRCYIELWKWARQCQHARIAISFKRKVVLQAPLVEWLLWCNQVSQDKASNGRVVFSRAGVSVAVVKAVIPPGKVRAAIRQARAHRGKTAPGSRPVVREGKWSANDQTPRPRKVSA